jgi:hypothetical protein
MRSTTLESSVNENSAAALMLTTPAIVVASRIEMRIGSILMPLVRVLQLPQAGHCNAQPAAALPRPAF